MVWLMLSAMFLPLWAQQCEQDCEIVVPEEGQRYFSILPPAQAENVVQNCASVVNTGRLRVI
jgi:hypothetical protein